MHLINYGGGGQVIALKSATAFILEHYLNEHFQKELSIHQLRNKSKHSTAKL